MGGRRLALELELWTGCVYFSQTHHSSKYCSTLNKPHFIELCLGQTLSWAEGTEVRDKDAVLEELTIEE